MISINSVNTCVQIRSILNPSISRYELKQFLNLCHKIAFVYLRKKEQSGRNFTYQFGISLEDFALDCIAELFIENENGVYTKFTNYFSKIDNLSKLSNEDLLISLRRLIFSQVNHHIYRTNKIFDPILGKIIRNIKLALLNHSLLHLNTYINQLIIELKNYSYKEDFNPVMPLEILEIELFSEAIHSNIISVIIGKLAEILINADGYKKFVYLMDVAFIIKSAKVNELKFGEFSKEDVFINDDIKSLINRTMNKVNQLIDNTYLQKNKITQATAECYTKTIIDILHDSYLNQPASSDHYFEHLCNYMPGMTKTDYNEVHRTKIEYIAKTAKNEINRLLKKEYFSLQ